MICSSILEAVGHTPLVRLNRMVAPDMAEVLVKFEALNVGGSIKTRTAYNMIRDAEARGLIKPDSVIVEPTSGNQGIGLALVGAVRGYRTVIVMPDSVSEERRKLVQQYGAEVVLVHDAGNIGDAIAECSAIAQRMAKENPKVYVPEQFSNPANPAAHRHGTALEIMEQAAKPIHGFCSGVGRAERSAESERSSRRRIRRSRYGLSSRRMRRSSPAERSARICRWASATA